MNQVYRFAMKYLIIVSLITSIVAGVSADSLQHSNQRNRELLSDEKVPDSIDHVETETLRATTERVSLDSLEKSYLPLRATTERVSLDSLEKSYLPLRATTERVSLDSLEKSYLPLRATTERVSLDSLEKSYLPLRATTERVSLDSLEKSYLPLESNTAKLKDVPFMKVREAFRKETFKKPTLGTKGNKIVKTQIKSTLLQTSEHLSIRPTGSASLVFLRSRSPRASRFPVTAIKDIKPTRKTSTIMGLTSRINDEAKRSNIGQGLMNSSRELGSDTFSLEVAKQLKSVPVHRTTTNMPDASTKRKSSISRTNTGAKSDVIGQGITNWNGRHRNNKSSFKEVKQPKLVHRTTRKIPDVHTTSRRPVPGAVTESVADINGHVIPKANREHGSERPESTLNNQPNSQHEMKNSPYSTTTKISKKSPSKLSLIQVVTFPPRGKRMSKPAQPRKRRYTEFYGMKDWDYEYDYDYDGPKTDVEKFLDDWHRDGLRTLGFLTVGCCIFFTCCCACQTALRSACNSCSANCQACADRVRCRDATYRKFCKAAGPLGLKMSYRDYKKLKKNYTEYAHQKYGQEAPRII